MRTCVLLEPLGTTPTEEQTTDTLISVMSNGYIYSIPIRFSLQDYLFTPEQKSLGLIPHLLKLNQSVFHNSKLAITDILAYSKNLNITCLGHFEPIPQTKRIRAEISKDRKSLIISGVIYNKIPSIAVYSIKPKSLSLVFVDSLFGVIDMCFHPSPNTLLALPRAMTGMISQVTLPATMPEHYSHRVIPQITFLGHPSKRMMHIISCKTTTHHQFATWTDDERPTISFWRVSPEPGIQRWFETSMQLMIPAFIQNLQVDSKGDRLGFVLQTEEYTSIAIWDLKKETDRQNNLMIPSDEFGQVLTSKWQQPFNVVCGPTTHDEAFYVLTTKGLFMHNGSQIWKWPQTEIPMTNFYSTKGIYIFYVNTEGELHMISVHEGDVNAGGILLKSQKAPPVPFVKATMKGPCDTAVGVHCYRCSNCRMPLIHPLVCSSDGLECCYCSKSCQEEHWPMLVAVNSYFSLDPDIRTHPSKTSKFTPGGPLSSHYMLHD
ncbi:hypothetical protein TVAG_243350 [Trichomonas vaginalis G3]|uniref:Uncharacterized protein n=1 Tax=Trichomonas vaginalis (strain ATCC PRA-98 / G3) TaxID=412133 RepID=A2FI18_TRIV3|nr:tricorn protease domain 2 family [Trichomonas vaginalis G3]EAX95446.1 hypothetical protein TVAG_243350 [Trichomonas vaginalis G3]KAI5542877.1 tricorn protease domain 2 family [Trichomonas vaginalis G3]|eukprot:XP_001308376.1 hypothetical protein [Trichomonas vaginalis G3]